MQTKQSVVLSSFTGAGVIFDSQCPALLLQPASPLAVATLKQTIIVNRGIPLRLTMRRSELLV